MWGGGARAPADRRQAWHACAVQAAQGAQQTPQAATRTVAPVIREDQGTLHGGGEGGARAACMRRRDRWIQAGQDGREPPPPTPAAPCPGESQSPRCFGRRARRSRGCCHPRSARASEGMTVRR